MYNLLKLNHDYDHRSLITACMLSDKISDKAKYKQKIEPVYNNEIKVQKIKRVLIQTKWHLIPAQLFDLIKFERIISKKEKNNINMYIIYI